jgi:hypothetical protein
MAIMESLVSSSSRSAKWAGAYPKDLQFAPFKFVGKPAYHKDGGFSNSAWYEFTVLTAAGEVKLQWSTSKIAKAIYESYAAVVAEGATYVTTKQLVGKRECWLPVESKA